MVETLLKDRMLTLTPDEHAELLSILEQAHLNMRVEQRRTDAKSYREKLLQKESVVHGLLEKVRHLS